METNDNIMKIKAIMEYYGLTQTAMATRLGIPQTNLSAMLGGKRACGKGIMVKVQLNFPEINIKWLYQDGEQMITSSPAVQQNNVHGDNNYNNGVVQIGPAFGALPAVTATEVTADGVEVLKCPKCHTMIDVTSLALVPVIPSEIMKTPDIDMAVYIKKHPDKLSEINLAQLWGAGAIAVEVDTRAMEPAYKEGTFVVIRQLPDLSYARADGTEYVIDAMRPHALLRYLTKERDGNYVLTAENEKKSPIYLKAEEIFGVWDIVGSFRLRR